MVVPAGREVPARRLWCETLLLLRKTDTFRFVRRHPPRKRRRGENVVVIMLLVGIFPTEPRSKPSLPMRHAPEESEKTRRKTPIDEGNGGEKERAVGVRVQAGPEA